MTNTFLSEGDRTIDQMVQSARSGKQNIAEGSVAASTSAETEIKLKNEPNGSIGTNKPYSITTSEIIRRRVSGSEKRG